MEQVPNVVHGTVDVNPVFEPTVGVDKTATPDEVVAVARRIYREALASTSEDPEERLKRIRAANPDFAKSFPVVLRAIVVGLEFGEKAFRKFLKNHVKVMYKDRHEFLLCQAEYLILFYREKHPRAGGGDIARYREYVSKKVREDDKIFTDANSEAEKAATAEDEDVRADRRRRLLAYIAGLKAAAK